MQAYFDMVYLFSCAAFGVEPQAERCKAMDLPAIREQALLQGVWPFVFTSLQKVREQGGLDDWKRPLEEAKRDLLFAVMSYTQRHAMMLDKVRLLEQAGIPVCILKGDSLAVLYAQPECRISGDVDILIPPYFEKKACAILKEEGFELTTRSKGLPHVEGYHAEAGHLEMHVMLYDDVSGEQWFPSADSIQELFGKFRTEYGEFAQLGPTDGALFVFFHFVKHFLYWGGGVKQLADVLVYFSKNKEIINWKRITSTLDEAKCKKLFATMAGVGVKYFGFARDTFPFVEENEDLIDRLMQDLYERGGFLRETDEDGIIFVPYIKGMLKMRGIDGDRYLTKKQRSKTKSLLFPRAKTIESNYPYVKKSKLMLPVAWLHRALRFLLAKLKGKPKKTGIYKNVDLSKMIQEKRSTLAKDLGMI